MSTSTPGTRADFEYLDQRDELRSSRERFDLPEGEIYLDGNSLGAMPAHIPARIEKVIKQEWAHGLIRSWNDADWYPAPQRTGAKIAGLIGAQGHEVIVADSTSINLFKVLVAATRLRPGRRVILAERGNFPTDVYIADGVAELTGNQLRCVEPDDILDALDEEVAIVSLTHVNFKSGKRYDMARITERAHAVGALVVWDLCHSAGAMPIALNEVNADFAVGCGYKYLNGGPGAPAFVFVAERHIPHMRQPITGWHGHAKPFDFDHHFRPHPSIGRMLAGTAPQLGVLALEAALEVFDDVDLNALRQKSVALGDLFISLCDQQLAGLGVELRSPRDGEQRGSQVSLAHEQAYAVMQALIARGIVGDFRAPDILRFGFAPLYIRYVDIWDSVVALREILEQKEWDRPEFLARKSVT
ncbi:Kynureninase [Pseudomonas taetrolens]|uniref:Kynureninase n=1 Tax=Pseudomonas taetrolens TaxID=47884 RepID=A0A0J6GT13_PSETA|nr:kynureninase [Pseudomonas taetrolens]KMM85234.1 kynureninase [Pseudomonas taetrolens]SEC41876.1 Kynureninase [Pseudomonas taetrolens]SQF86530.1 kynureninase [Pseudomonas taetrolens]VEH49607.1 kynureninase [Pseudomonas taetrolens]